MFIRIILSVETVTSLVRNEKRLLLHDVLILGVSVASVSKNKKGKEWVNKNFLTFFPGFFLNYVDVINAKGLVLEPMWRKMGI